MNLATIACVAALSLPSGVTLERFGGFEMYDWTWELADVEQGEVTNAIICHNTKETYYVDLGEFEDTGGPSWAKSDSFTVSAGDFVTVGTWIRLDGISGYTNFDILEIGTSGDPWIEINVSGSDGDLRVKDNNGSIGSTVEDVFVNQVWTLLEVKVEVNDTGGDEDYAIHVNGAEVLTGTDDLYGTSLTGIVRWNAVDTFAPSLGEPDQLIDNFYIQLDDGASITANDTFFGRFSVVGPYGDDDNATTSDFGDDLDQGKWYDALEIPPSSSKYGRYTATGGSDGGVTADDGDYAGPAGDDRLEKCTIVGASWLGYYFKTGAGAQAVKMRYGSNSTASVDNTTLTSSYSLSSAKSIEVYVDSSDANCPDRDTEYMQLGMQKQNHGFIYGTCNVGDHYSFVLVQEPRTVILDGSVQIWER